MDNNDNSQTPKELDADFPFTLAVHPSHFQINPTCIQLRLWKKQKMLEFPDTIAYKYSFSLWNFAPYEFEKDDLVEIEVIDKEYFRFKSKSVYEEFVIKLYFIHNILNDFMYKAPALYHSYLSACMLLRISPIDAYFINQDSITFNFNKIRYIIKNEPETPYSKYISEHKLFSLFPEYISKYEKVFDELRKKTICVISILS